MLMKMPVILQLLAFFYFTKYPLLVKKRGVDTIFFINCIAFDKTGELVSEYVKKGQIIKKVNQNEAFDELIEMIKNY